MKLFQRVTRPADMVGWEVPYGSRVLGKPLASGKLVYREVCSEGSQPANSGTDEQESHMRLLNEDKQAHHCNVRNF